MADCVKDVAKCIFTEALWPPVKRHIDYWWCFDGNVQGLRDEITNLETEMSNRNRKIEDARLAAESATTDVQNWSNEGTQKLEEATRILQGCDDLKVWKLCPRYFKGKSAKETAEGIAKLRNEGNSIRIADPAPPAAMVPITHAPTLEFQSRKSIEEDMMKYLKDGNVRMIAICGAGGVGKTTMAERIVDRVRADKLFVEVVSVVVSQPIDKLKIQKQIAEILRLGLSEETLDGRAHILRTRLMDSMKKLIIFDDVWESFQVKDIGVPYGGCKIMFTSRDKDVCGEMEADKVIEIEVLGKEEAWTLFREKSGDCVDDFDLRPIAEKVAAECKGLPIALATVGKALKNKSKKTWEDALLQLKGANPTNFPQVLKNVYMPLKLSYDFLETESEKYLFLLCCLFPEDYNIKIEDLALLGFGLRLFKGINNIEDGRKRTSNLLERLRSRFLSMTGRNEDEVKLHDVVRDVAIFIGSEEKQGFLKSLEVCSIDLSSRDSSCYWMSVDISVVNAKLPIGLDFPNLRLLMILNSSYGYPEGFDINVIGFKGMEELTVLYFSNQNFPSLPSSLKFLKKLRKLHLDDCEVKDISVVGELASLEILGIFWCNDIEEVPADVGKLKFLRLLELRECEKLERIVFGVISSLVGLEELKIVDCFNKWEAKGNNVSEERNASLSELESLRNLTSLEIDKFHPNLVAQEILLSKHLTRYKISSYKDSFVYDVLQYERKITLNLPREVTVRNWIRQLVKNTESLALDGDGSNNFNLGEIESLRKLVFENCSTVEKLVNAVDCKFPMLEHLELRKLKELEDIIDGTIPEGSNSFKNLKSLVVDELPKLRYLWKSPNQNVNLNSIYISRCHNLRSLFSMATARSLVQLQSLQIYFCDTMESNTEVSIIEFPKLKTLKLFHLPNLVAFIQGVEIIKFPMLEHLELIKLKELEEIIDGTIPEGSNSFQNLQSLVVDDLPKLRYLWKSPNQNVYLLNLNSIYISRCPNLRSLFSMATARSLVQLQSLQILFCDTMEQVLWNETESNTEASIIEFLKLKTLKLYNLPNLVAFTKGVEIIKFPQLIELEIMYCPKLRTKIDKCPTCTIEKLFVRNGDTIEEIFRDDGNRHIIFQELYELDLNDLSCLTAFYRGVESIKFPKLKWLRIGNLPMLNGFVAIDSEPTHDNNSLHFFCNEKVEMIGMKILYLENLSDKISKIWCRHIPIPFFHNLEELNICRVDGITNLISSSIAKALVNLNSLSIQFCKRMVDVIEDETDVIVNSVCPNLKYLDIRHNCKLRSFCQWKHAFELPSLEEVGIANCPLMKTFTLGSLTTPKLHRFHMNGNDIEMKDLNGGIHHFTSTEITNKDENNDEYSEDEYSDEDQKEIEGEEKTESSNNINLM